MWIYKWKLCKLLQNMVRHVIKVWSIHQQNHTLTQILAYVLVKSLLLLITPAPEVLVLYHRFHDDVIKWKHFSRYWPFVREFTGDLHIGQSRGALVFSLICACINGWVNNHEAGYLRSHRALYDVTVMYWRLLINRLSILTCFLECQTFGVRWAVTHHAS